MRLTLLSSVLLLLAPGLSLGQSMSKASEDQVFFKRVDAATQDLVKRVREIKSCKEDEAFYTSELARKTDALKAANAGKVPPPYSPMLLMMEKRVERTQATCQQLFNSAGSGFDQIHSLLRSVQQQRASEKEEVRSRMAALGKVRAEYNRLGIANGKPTASDSDEGSSDSSGSDDSSQQR